MNMLFLDDEQYRHSLAVVKWSDKYAIDHVRTAQEAIAAIKAFPYDLVSLDHDLLPEHYQKKALDKDTGYDVAQFIAGMNPARRPKGVIVHSLSTSGSKRMIDVLSEAGIPVARDDIFSGIKNLSVGA